MGCSGSKTGKANTAPADATAAAQAESPAQIPEGDFKIHLVNASGSQPLGAVVKFPANMYILVESVKQEGLIPEWNKGCENTPEMQVNAGDFIVVINGVFGNSDLMLPELFSKAITLTVKRGQALTDMRVPEAPAAAAAQGPAAPVPAAEAPAMESAVENPVAEVAEWKTAAAEVAVTEAAAAERPAVETPVLSPERLVAEAPPAYVSAVFPEASGFVEVGCDDAEVDTSAKEERLCNLAIC
jgi:hypothetical protein